MAKLTVDGATLAYEERGEGSPAMVFIHGWACDRQCWGAQLAEFSRDHRCIAVDLRGRGESDAVPPFGVGRALEDVAALVRSLGIGPVILVGHSLGGIIALAVNGRYPELVLGVVTIDSKTGEVTRNLEYYALAHASKFVRPGARRIGSTAADGPIQSVAFQNADGSIALVLLNDARHATTLAAHWQGMGLRYTMPPRSVATLTWPAGAAD